MKIKRFNDINENFADRNIIIEKFENTEISLYGDFFNDIPNYSDHSVSASLQWDYEFDTSRSGVDGIIPSIINIEVNALVETYDDNDVQDEQEIILNFNGENSTIVINDRETIGEYEKQVLPYYPQDIEIEKDKETGKVTITINFV